MNPLTENKILSNHLYALCQALDLRAMSLRFMSLMREEIKSSLLSTGIVDEKVTEKFFRHARHQYIATVDQDSGDRFEHIVQGFLADWILTAVDLHETNGKATEERNAARVPHLVRDEGLSLSHSLRDRFRENREAYFKDGSAEHLLGSTKSIYNFVRKTLGVRMLKGLDKDVECSDVQLSRIYRSFDSGEIIKPLLEALGSPQR